MLSAAVLGWLVRGIDGVRLGELLASVDLRWLLLAFGLKIGSLVLHELRTWMPLPSPRPPLGETIRLCLGIGLLNLVLPARAGDVGIIAALNRRYRVPLGTATAVVGVTSFIEAAVFALILLAIIADTALPAASALPLPAQLGPTGLLLVAGAGSLLAVAVAVLIGRLLARRPRPAGILGILHQTLVDTATLLSSPVILVRNTAVALLQVGLLVAAFAAGVPAAGIHDVPAFAVGGQVLAVSSLASVLFPPTWGVGPAAASRVVLGAAGLGAEEAILYAGVYWLIAHLPFLLVGLPALWSLRRQGLTTD